MKIIIKIIAMAILLAPHFSIAQFNTMPGSFVTADTNSVVVLNNTGLANHAAAALFQNVFKFTGDADVRLSGTEPIRFTRIVLEKTANAKLELNADITVDRSLSFYGGTIDLHNKTINLGPAASLMNESKLSRITGAGGGFVSIRTNAASLAANPGNLGAIISASKVIGNVTVKRGHKTQTGVSMDESIERYYDIEFANKELNHVRLSFDHFDSELNGQEEARIKIYSSHDKGFHWNEQTNTVRNTVTDVELAGETNSAQRWTFATPEHFSVDNGSSAGVLRIWPNPASNYFYVQANADGDAHIRVFDLSGKSFGSYTTKKGSPIKIENLSPGVYIIKADGNNLNKSNRVIVMDKNINQRPGTFKTSFDSKMN